MEEEGKDDAGTDDVFDFEGINGWIMRWSGTWTSQIDWYPGG